MQSYDTYFVSIFCSPLVNVWEFYTHLLNMHLSLGIVVYRISRCKNYTKSRISGYKLNTFPAQYSKFVRIIEMNDNEL